MRREPMRMGGQDGFCMGVTALPESRIRAGVHALSRLVRTRFASGPRALQDEPVAPLRGRALRQAMSGAVLLYNTVYGDPCTLELRRDGELVGVAGRAGEDCDRGRWWRSEEHTSELQSLMRSSYAVFCLKTKTQKTKTCTHTTKQKYDHHTIHE